MRKVSSMLSVAVLSVLVSASAQAQARFGVQGSYGSDSDLGVGARVELPLTGKLSKTEPLSNAFFIGSFDYYFMDCGPDFAGTDVSCAWWELNPSLAIPLKAQTLKPYVGAGLNIANASVSSGGETVSDTETGLNLLGGLKFKFGTMDAFSEARLSLGGGEQFAVSFGILFGGSKAAAGKKHR